ncbi:MAG: hypothetical protein QM489_05245 [Candidatus Izemoplasma sp.]
MIFIIYLASLALFLPSYAIAYKEENINKEENKKFQMSNTSLIIKVYYLLFYLPLYILYFNKRQSFTYNVISILFYIILVFIVIKIMKYLLYKKWGLELLKIWPIITIFALLFMLISSRTINYTNLIKEADKDNFYVKYSELEVDYTSVNHYSIDDDTLDGELVDFVVSDDYLYYIVSDDHDSYLTVYSNETKEVIRTRKLESVINYKLTVIGLHLHIEESPLKEVEGDIYLFDSNGIYLLDGLVETKISDFSSSNINHYNTNGTSIDFSYNSSDDVYEIYSLNHNGLVLIDVLDYTETPDRYSVYSVTDKLVIKDLELGQLNIYGGNTFEISPYYVELITDEFIIYYYDSSYRNSDRIYYITYNNGDREILDNVNSNYKILETYNDMYYDDSYSIWWFDYNDNNYFFDEHLNPMYSFNLIIMQRTILADNEYKLSIVKYVYGDRFYYGIFEYNNESLSFEINELIYIEPTISSPYFDYIGKETIFIIGSILLVPIFKFPKRKKELSKREIENINIDFSKY